MANEKIAVSLPVDLWSQVSHFAEIEGVTVEQWIIDALVSKLETSEFFHHRVQGASVCTLGELLDKAPSRPPDPGDGFDD